VLPEGLAWPPKKEDLERLYLVEKLSAAKIAERYGLIGRYKTTKVAESTVLHHLKKNGIAMRDPAEHVRRVTEQMVDEWVKRYHGGESLKRIAGDLVSPVTVMLHLEARGINRRDKIQSQIAAVTKHKKYPFNGTREAIAYLIGFSRGDLNVSRHGRAIRVKTSTTHPLMIELLKKLFTPYGHVLIYPRKSELAGYEWSFQADLDLTFVFLWDYRRSLPKWIFRKKYFLSFVSGVFDAEGSIVLNQRRILKFEMGITNSDVGLLELISAKMKKLGYPFRLYRTNESVWQLRIWDLAKVMELLRVLLLQHPEKLAKAAIALSRDEAIINKTVDSLEESWRSLKREIRSGRDAFVNEARTALENDAGT
jgi:hypothetical protein